EDEGPQRVADDERLILDDDGIACRRIAACAADNGAITDDRPAVNAHGVVFGVPGTAVATHDRRGVEGDLAANRDAVARGGASAVAADVVRNAAKEPHAVVGCRAGDRYAVEPGVAAAFVDPANNAEDGYRRIIRRWRRNIDAHVSARSR